MDLGAFLVAEAARPWEWGKADCSTTPADWVLADTGIDPMGKWRGYTCEADVELLIAQAGSLHALWAEGMADIWQPTIAPTIGAVGLIIMPGEHRRPIEVGAIFSGKRWSFRTPRGMAGCSVDPANVVAIWAR
jgi:hypothetical protein